MLNMVVILGLLSTSAAFAKTCFSEGTGKKFEFYMERVGPEKDFMKDDSIIANIIVLHVDGQETVKEFAVTGTYSMMPAGEMTELENKAEQFKYEDGFNGSELNAWVIPETVTYQGTTYSSCK